MHTGNCKKRERDREKERERELKGCIDLHAKFETAIWPKSGISNKEKGEDKGKKREREREREEGMRPLYGEERWEGGEV